MENLCPMGESIFIHRRAGEVHYLEVLCFVKTKRIEACADETSVYSVARVRNRSQLRIKFRYFHQVGPHWNVFVKAQVNYVPNMSWRFDISAQQRSHSGMTSLNAFPRD